MCLQAPVACSRVSVLLQLSFSCDYLNLDPPPLGIFPPPKANFALQMDRQTKVLAQFLYGKRGLLFIFAMAAFPFYSHQGRCSCLEGVLTGWLGAARIPNGSRLIPPLQPHLH